MAKLPFANHTSLILNELPHWFNMRKKSYDSHGADYLNISGLNLDDALYVLDYAYKQCYINSIDLKQIELLFPCLYQ